MILTSIQSCLDWLSLDVPSDLTVETGGARFALHKAPLVSKCGRIRRMLAVESTDTDRVEAYLNLPELPGGAEAFELVAKYCYGLDLGISTYNVAAIRCAAEYLEMEQEPNIHGLDSLAQSYFNNIVLPNLANTIAVLRSCNNLLPLADDLQIVNICIKNIVSVACNELMVCRNGWDSEDQKGLEESWVKKLTELHIDFFERIMSAMKARGVKQEIISGALMNYAHNSLDGLSQKQREQRSVVEGIAALLPPGKNAAPTSFLSGLLRTAITVDASPQCRMELESRLAMSLDRATSHDLLVVSFSHSSDTLFDVEVVQRVVTNFLAFALTDSAGDEYEEDEQGAVEFASQISGNAMEKVSTLMDSYLAEIAPDKNLNISKFILLAEAVGEKGRLVDDGLYRAIDICLKAHPAATDGERNKLCKLMDCQKLSAEACMHAAKNHRLPLHVVVQVLYFEQLRLRHEIKSGSTNDLEFGDKCPSQVMNKRFLSALSSSRDGYESVRMENRDLRFEFCRMRMRMTDLEKQCVRMNQIMVRPRCPNALFASISKTLGKFHSLFRSSLRILLFSKTSGHEHMSITTVSTSNHFILKGHKYK
ncbi:hypothetical protein SUGI_0291520 [Cryptomeria japonica]|nr:hypothetical protein SUGI_0291520 [Cryptomeria japonica]